MPKRSRKLITEAANRYLTLLSAEDIEPVDHSSEEYLKFARQNNEHAASLLSEVLTLVRIGWLNEALLLLGRAEGILLGTGFLSPKRVLSLD